MHSSSSYFSRVRAEWLWLAGGIILGILLRLPGMHHALNHDEIYTVQAFASLPYSDIATSYDVPNNHIFHTILVRLATQLFGQHEWSIRLPAFLAGILAIPGIYLLTRVMIPLSRVAILSSWILALHPVHISYSQSARGYSLLVFLTIFTLMFLWMALKGNRLAWLGYAVASFLATYTLPVGLLHLLAVTLAIILLSLQRRDWTALCFGTSSSILSLILTGIAYWSIRDEVASSADHWGIEVWEQPIALARTIGEAAILCMGNWVGIATGILALIGLASAVMKRDRWTVLFLLTWSVPFLAALGTGVAGQPRTYLFLLPGFVLSAAYGTAKWTVPVPLRIILLLLAIGGYAWHSSAAIDRVQKENEYKHLAEYLSDSAEAGDIVITPYLRDLQIGYYAGDEIAEGLLSAIVERSSERLMFVTSSEDRQSILASFPLRSNITRSVRQIHLPERSFDDIFTSGPIGLHKIRNSGYPVLTGDISWQASYYSGDPAEIEIALGDIAFHTSPGLSMINRTDAEIGLHSQDRFVAEHEGFLVLLYAQESLGSHVSVYRVLDNGKRIVEEEMLLGSTQVVRAGSRDGKLWYIQRLIIPVRQNDTFGLYVWSNRKGHHNISDITTLLFPFPYED